jgi:hypothetical protein
MIVNGISEVGIEALCRNTQDNTQIMNDRPEETMTIEAKRETVVFQCFNLF